MKTKVFDSNCLQKILEFYKFIIYIRYKKGNFRFGQIGIMEKMSVTFDTSD